jgi:hypothetical protein
LLAQRVSENLAVLVIEPETFGSVATNSHHQTTEADNNSNDDDNDDDDSFTSTVNILFEGKFVKQQNYEE